MTKRSWRDYAIGRTIKTFFYDRYFDDGRWVFDRDYVSLCGTCGKDGALMENSEIYYVCGEKMFVNYDQFWGFDSDPRVISENAKLRLSGLHLVEGHIERELIPLIRRGQVNPFFIDLDLMCGPTSKDGYGACSIAADIMLELAKRKDKIALAVNMSVRYRRVNTTVQAAWQCFKNSPQVQMAVAYGWKHFPELGLTYRSVWSGHADMLTLVFAKNV